MKALERTILKSVIFVAGAGLASAAFAGGGSAGSVTTVPGASGIPTMGGGALMMLSVLMAVIAVRVMRSSKNKTINMAVVAAAVLSLASGIGGVKLVSDSEAGMGMFITNSNGQTINVFEGFNRIINDSGVIQRVVDITLAQGCTQVYDSGLNGGFPINGGMSGRLIIPNGGYNGGEKGDVGNCSVSPSSDIPDGGSCTLIVDCGNLNGGNNGGNGGLMNGGFNGGFDT